MLLYRECGSPARATLIVDWSGRVRYMAAHRTDITRLDFVNIVNIIDLVDITIIGTINIILTADSFLVFIPRNVAEILRLVQAFRHSDLTGQVGEIDRILLSPHSLGLLTEQEEPM